MAKIVSTKFGDRRLVYLPPINITAGVKTANVETIEPARKAPHGYRYGEGQSKQSHIVPKEYAYRGSDRLREQKQAWLGSPRDGVGEGNLVNEDTNLGIGDQVFRQLYQQATMDSLQNYQQGRYPVLPPVPGDPKYMQYTTQGLANMTQPQVQEPPPLPPVQPQPAPLPAPAILPPPQASSDPNEKHIYYGPNGEVLPGPPNNVPRGFIEDFAFEGILRNGRLMSVNLVDSQRGFPRIPDILLRDLFQKYGQFEETLVRVVAKRGHFYVHATPNMPDVSPRIEPVGQPSLEPEYVPVYLEEGEEFDYNKFIHNYRNGNYQYQNRNKFPNAVPPRGRYRTPPLLERNDMIPSRDRRVYSPDIRPSSYDPVSHLRWKKDDRRWTSDSRRLVYTGRQTAVSDSGQYYDRASKYDFDRSNNYTRDDIKPIESLRPRYRRR